MKGQHSNTARSHSIRLALMLAGLALTFYVGFILMTGLN
jgi:hypothetical protein